MAKRAIQPSVTEQMAAALLHEPVSYCYVRVSRDDLSKKIIDADDAIEQMNRSIAAHTAECMTYYAKAVPALPKMMPVFADTGISSDVPLNQRPAGKLLCEALRKGDHLIIPAIARAFRNTAEALTTIEGWRKEGVILHVCNFNSSAPVETETMAGNALVEIMAFCASMEKKAIKERFRLGKLYCQRNNLPVSYKQGGIGCIWHDGAWRRTWELDLLAFYANLLKRGWSVDGADEHMASRWYVARPMSVVGQSRVWTAFEVLYHSADKNEALAHARGVPDAFVMQGAPRLRSPKCGKCQGNGRVSQDGERFRCDVCKGWGRVPKAWCAGTYMRNHYNTIMAGSSWRRCLESENVARNLAPERDKPRPGQGPHRQAIMHETVSSENVR